MKWMDFIDYGPKPSRVNIRVRLLGLPKVVVVRTKLNGGI